MHLSAAYNACLRKQGGGLFQPGDFWAPPEPDPADLSPDQLLSAIQAAASAMQPDASQP